MSFFFLLCWFLVAMHGLSLIAEGGVYSSCGAWASHCEGFSLWSTGSRHMGFSSCSMQAQYLWLAVSRARGLQ